MVNRYYLSDEVRTTNSVEKNYHKKLENNKIKMTADMYTRPFKKRKIEYDIKNVEVQV
jgi:hypothetical protein